MPASAAAPLERMGSDRPGGPDEPVMVLTSQQGTAARETQRNEWKPHSRPHQACRLCFCSVEGCLGHAGAAGSLAALPAG